MKKYLFIILLFIIYYFSCSNPYIKKEINFNRLNRISIIERVRDNIFWIGTEGGIVKFDIKNNIYKEIKLPYNIEYNPDKYGIRSIAIDNKSDEIWFGTDGDGIIILNKFNHTWRQIRKKIYDFSRRANISSIVIYSNFAYVSTYGGGFFRINRNNNKIQEISLFDISNFFNYNDKCFENFDGFVTYSKEKLEDRVKKIEAIINPKILNKLYKSYKVYNLLDVIENSSYRYVEKNSMSTFPVMKKINNLIFISTRQYDYDFERIICFNLTNDTYINVLHNYWSYIYKRSEFFKVCDIKAFEYYMNKLLIGGKRAFGILDLSEYNHLTGTNNRGIDYDKRIDIIVAPGTNTSIIVNSIYLENNIAYLGGTFDVHGRLTDDGIIKRYNLKTETFFKDILLKKIDISCIYKLKNDVLLIGTWGNGLIIYNLKNNSIIKNFKFPL